MEALCRLQCSLQTGMLPPNWQEASIEDLGFRGILTECAF